MSGVVPDVALNNGVEMPMLGFGVFQTPPEETRIAVEAALTAGYRHIDTAAAYGNERQVGEALVNSGVPRSEVFIETKIWISDYGYDATLHGFDKSAGKLGLDQIDLLILHQALPSDFDKTTAAYRALETLLKDGKVRAIGVSNFMVEHLTRLLDSTTVTPAVNQIEVHPLLSAARSSGVRSPARHPDSGLVADRGHHLLPRRQAHEHPRGPSHPRCRQRSFKEPGAGHAPLASAGRPLGHPRVDQAAAHRREHRRIRFRAHARRTLLDGRTRHRYAWRP
jgi:aryl-alcohol dehydrogenase-like predicted oxidoreductase